MSKLSTLYETLEILNFNINDKDDILNFFMKYIKSGALRIYTAIDCTICRVSTNDQYAESVESFNGFARLYPYDSFLKLLRNERNSINISEIEGYLEDDPTSLMNQKIYLLKKQIDQTNYLPYLPIFYEMLIIGKEEDLYTHEINLRDLYFKDSDIFKIMELSKAITLTPVPPSTEDLRANERKKVALIMKSLIEISKLTIDGPYGETHQKIKRQIELNGETVGKDVIGKWLKRIQELE